MPNTDGQSSDANADVAAVPADLDGLRRVTSS